ncbi:class I SAM-dependent methyltransferase [Streptomyces hundungensis]|uniref:class I SAM-dependent methyltransferase n=1 Tax=Streptomyces hundungensis TaxID=1077946 RepID=UPI003400503F
MSDTRSAAWDEYPRSKPQRRPTNARGDTTWFNWTQYADHGPGAEVLNLKAGDSVLDLGCGSGGNAAHSLLPVAHANLKPGGVLAFSQRPPVEGCYGCQASYIPRGPDEDPAIVKRWDYAPEIWCSLLKEYGFWEVTAKVLAACEHDRRTTGTLLVRAVRGDQPQLF